MTSENRSKGSQSPADFQITPDTSIEQSLTERGEVTIDSLWTDNHSPLASALREEFTITEERGELTVVNRCSDSRYILYPTYVAIPTISVGGEKIPYSGIYNDPSTKNILVLPHMPCGGLLEREQLIKEGFPDTVGDSGKYVKEDILHHDPVVQGTRVARDISRLTDKNVFLAVHTQTNGVNNPIGVAYRNGEPYFTNTQTPDDLAELLHRNARYVQTIASEFPNLSEMQQTQNPHLLVISHNRRPAESEFPATSRRPGSTFRILIPMPEDQFVDPNAARTVIHQAHYPVTQFSNLSRILIETDSMGTSRQIYERFMQRPWMQDWESRPGNQVFLASSKEGELSDIDEAPLVQVR